VAKTAIVAYDAQAFETQILGFSQLLGSGQHAKAEVIGYQLFEDDGGFIGGDKGNPQADLEDISRAFKAWNPTALADGKPLLVQCKVRLLPNGPNSSWLSFSEALALVFPQV
jgi:hypothetical protein